MYGESPCTQLDWFIEAAHGEPVVNPKAFELVCTWKLHLRAAQELIRVKQADMCAQFNMNKRALVPFTIGQTVMLSAKVHAEARSSEDVPQGVWRKGSLGHYPATIPGKEDET
jgi:hypothetical protein